MPNQYNLRAKDLSAAPATPRKPLVVPAVDPLPSAPGGNMLVAQDFDPLANPIAALIAAAAASEPVGIVDPTVDFAEIVEPVPAGNPEVTEPVEVPVEAVAPEALSVQDAIASLT